MRLSGGAKARRSLAAPKGAKTRPTSAKVREALFAVLGKRIEEARVLDLFAGSGALGLEAISRGAGSVVFVDSDADAVMAVRRNAVRVIDEKDRFRIMPMPAIRALRALRGTFDVVLVDPPYERGAREELATLMQRGLVAADGVVVVEHRSGEDPPLPGSLKVLKSAKYGDTALTFAAVRPARESVPEERAAEASPAPKSRQPARRQKSRRP
ncbi:MAG TPA: 16S rRNA (guanine(966)-N(2))-methyltransferase RsmD [Candidatus Eremiobacteraceae bacterium]|nr:16S rRNA (guanine(966)-N(2))-methyltransferase RsmD [Candidatus Eremiobacteraceae bacterium]